MIRKVVQAIEKPWLFMLRYTAPPLLGLVIHLVSTIVQAFYLQQVFTMSLIFERGTLVAATHDILYHICVLF